MLKKHYLMTHKSLENFAVKQLNFNCGMFLVRFVRTLIQKQKTLFLSIIHTKFFLASMVANLFSSFQKNVSQNLTSPLYTYHFEIESWIICKFFSINCSPNSLSFSTDFFRSTDLFLFYRNSQVFLFHLICWFRPIC